MSVGLVQAGFLFGLVALAIPLVIHLMFRQKPRQVDIGSIRFLQKIMEKSRSRRTIMRWLLLSLRMVCLALLAFLFTRPFMPERSEGFSGQRLIVILIDRSASMQLQSDGSRLVDLAVDQAKKLILDAKSRTHFEVAFFDHEVQPVTGDAGTEASVQQLLRQMVAPVSSYSATDYAAAFRWAHDICVAGKAQFKHLHIFTDLQQSGLAWSDVEPMPDNVIVQVHDLGRDLPNNVAITAAQPSRLIVRPNEASQVRVSLLNVGPFTLNEVPVTLSIKNGPRPIHHRDKIELEPGSIATVEFELAPLEAGLWQGTVTVEILDDLPFDNQRQVAMLSAPQHRVLVVNGGAHASAYLSETFFLESALRLAPEGETYAESPYVPEVCSGKDPIPLPGPYDIAILANVGNLREDDVERLDRFVEQGGSLVVFTGDRMTAESCTSLSAAGLVPGKILGLRSSLDLPWRIGMWDTRHAIFKPFGDPQHGDLRQLAFRGLTDIRPSPQSKVVAQYNDGRPFLLEQAIGQQGGSIIWITTSCDGQWGRWAQRPLFLPIVHQVLGYIVGLNDGGPVRNVSIDTTAEQLTSRSPGIFRKEKHWQVVNVSARESETERCTIADFASRFELNIKQDERNDNVRTTSMAGVQQVRQNEIWHWVLFSLVALMAAEFCVGNRTVA